MSTSHSTMLSYIEQLNSLLNCYKCKTAGQNEHAYSSDCGVMFCGKCLRDNGFKDCLYCRAAFNPSHFSRDDNLLGVRRKSYSLIGSFNRLRVHLGEEVASDLTTAALGINTDISFPMRNAPKPAMPKVENPIAKPKKKVMLPRARAFKSSQFPYIICKGEKVTVNIKRYASYMKKRAASLKRRRRLRAIKKESSLSTGTQESIPSPPDVKRLNIGSSQTQSDHAIKGEKRDHANLNELRSDVDSEEDLFVQSSLKEPTNIVVMATKLTDMETVRLKRFGEMFHVEISDVCSKDVTHVVIGSDYEGSTVPMSFKVFYGMAMRCKIVRFTWIDDSLNDGVLFSDSRYRYASEDFPCHKREVEYKIFENLTISLVGTHVERDEIIQDMLEACGAKVLPLQEIMNQDELNLKFIVAGTISDAELKNITSKYPLPVFDWNYVADCIGWSNLVCCVENQLTNYSEEELTMMGFPKFMLYMLTDDTQNHTLLTKTV